MPTITLDAIRRSVSAKYEPLVIPFGDGRECTLIQVMRLDRPVREQLIREQGAISTAEGADYDEAGVLESLRRIVRLVASDPDAAAGLIDAIGDDLAVLTDVVETYTKGTQVPEA